MSTQGVHGRLLEVDLAALSLHERVVPDSVYERYVGGRGLALRLMLSDWLQHPQGGPQERPLLFATGPFQGTGVAGAGRHVVATVSPKTGAVSDSYAGGFFGDMLGKSGFDGILVRGRASSPVCLVIGKGCKPEIIPADEYWGLTTRETEAKLKERFPGCRVTSIGKAGERGVPHSCIINDLTHATGRPGFGAVMGGKNLKAIAIAGDQEKRIHNPKGFRTARTEFAKFLMDPKTSAFGRLGTTASVRALNSLGVLPTRNFAKGTFGNFERIEGEELYRSGMVVRRETCAGCPISCRRIVRTVSNEGVTETGGPEYETIAGFGSLCLNDDLDSIAVANARCNDLGLDTISTSVLIAAAMEAQEKGILPNGPKWGDGSAILRLIDEMVTGEGVGGILCQGVPYLRDELGWDFLVEMKGLESALHDPRGKLGYGIAVATSPRGATHLEGFHDEYAMVDDAWPELGVTGEAIDRLTFAGKVPLVILLRELTSFGNMLILCRFVSVIRTAERYSFDRIRALLGECTGLHLDAGEMLKAGSRGSALLRLLTSVAGYTRADDGLHQRLREARAGGEAISEGDLDQQIDEYYRRSGYGSKGPSRQLLVDLDMQDVLAELGDDYDSGAQI